jgi:hypothetical protein
MRKTMALKLAPDLLARCLPMSNSIDVRRLCLNYRPALLVVIYSHGNVLRSHEIDLTPFLFASPENAARELKAEYDMYLDAVNESQLARLMRKVRNYDGTGLSFHCVDEIVIL